MVAAAELTPEISRWTQRTPEQRPEHRGTMSRDSESSHLISAEKSLHLPGAFVHVVPEEICRGVCHLFVVVQAKPLRYLFGNCKSSTEHTVQYKSSEVGRCIYCIQYTSGCIIRGLHTKLFTPLSHITATITTESIYLF